VPDRPNLDQARGVIHPVDHAVLANTNAPNVRRTPEFPAARWAGICRERFNSSEHPLNDGRVKALKFLSGGPRYPDREVRHLA
jgi:hypothetical protein